MRDPAPPPPASDAILTVPNLLTFFRLGLIPLFLYVVLGLDNIGWGVVFAVVGFITDLVDGKIARRYGQISKLGIALDPLSDRLALASGAVVLIAKHLSPVWVVLTILSRDVLLVLIGAPILKAKGLPIPPVTKVGKYGSFAVSVTFALFLASGVPGPTHPSHPLRVAAWIFVGIAIPMYYASGIGYARVAIASLRANNQNSPKGAG